MKRAGQLTPEPPKLIELGHSYAALLARGNREYETSVKETAHFCRTHATSPHPRSGARRFWTVGLVAAALLVLVFGLTAESERPPNHHLIAAELAAASARMPAPPMTADPTLGDTSEMTLGGSSNTEPSHERGTRHDRPTRVRTPSVPPFEIPSEPKGAEPKPLLADTPLPQTGTAPRPDCREHARGGEPRKAEACYLERAKGSGLDAETALLEIARIRRDVLEDPAGALRALEGYRQRFPNGALRHEADINRAVLLARLGRSSQALAETERLLDSPQGRERAFELRLLRGNIYRKGLGNTARAAREYETAEKLERANSESTYLLGSCLEELGDADGARAAYHRYLERSPAGTRVAEVKKRLEKLTP